MDGEIKCLLSSNRTAATALDFLEIICLTSKTATIIFKS